MAKGKQKINCNVSSCTYNDCHDNCNLNEIKVSCDCNSDEVKNKAETICSSFKKSKEKE